MKKWIHASSYLDLPKGDWSQPAHPKNAKTAEEVEDVLFGSGDGLTQVNVLDAIRNPNTSSATLAKLSPYADYSPESWSRFSEYIKNSQVPKDVVTQLVVKEWPKVKQAVDSGEYVDWTLDKLGEIIDSIDIPEELKEEILYYVENGDQIAEEARNKAKEAEKRAKEAKRRSLKATIGELTNSSLVSFLKANGIDTTKHKYELYAEEYERYGSGGRYKKKFTCPGDYLAYFSMQLHRSPTAEALEDYGYDTEELEEFISEHSTVEDMDNYANSNWWGDGDDYIIYLKNLDTGEYLCEQEEEQEEEEEDWED